MPGPVRPLWKPEPGLLLTQAGLSLTAVQIEKIRAIDSAWQRERDQLGRAMDGFSPSRGRVDQVQAQLGDYSKLSRNYDAARTLHWEAAIRVLDSNQRRLVSK